MERDISKIPLINDWSYLIALETGLFTRGELSGAVLKALNDQARLLSRRYLVQKSKLDVLKLTPAETEILDTLSDTAASLRRRQRLPHNIVKSLRAGGLIAAVERSVCASGILQCHNGFYEDGLEPGAWVPILPVGVVLALLVEWSGSLWPAITAHGVVNALAVLLG